jgi:hypothetical protein
MTDEEREHLIKEVRLVVLHDIRMTLGKLLDERMGQQDEVNYFAKLMAHHIGLRIGEITGNTADRPRLSSLGAEPPVL